jgi:hypothetical protein
VNARARVAHGEVHNSRTAVSEANPAIDASSAPSEFGTREINGSR